MEFQNSRERFRKFILGGVIAVFVSLSLLYSVFIPAFESQDEVSHLIYMNHFASKMRLPDYRDPEELKSLATQGHQTPLYYFIGGLLIRTAGYRHVPIVLQDNPFQSAGTPAMYLHGRPEERFPYSPEFRIVHLLRLLNVVAGAFILLVIYKSVRLFPFHNQTFAIAATAFVALIPQFTYLSGTINNDIFGILFYSLALYFLMKFLLDPNAHVRYVALTAVAIGFGVLTKQWALSLIPLFMLTLLVKGTNRQKVKNFLALSAILSVLIGWYHVRNWLLFDDPFSVKALAALNPNLINKKSPMQLYQYFWPYWGSFGYMTVNLSWLTYLFFTVTAGIGLVAFATGFMDTRFRQRFSKEQKISMIILSIAILILLAEILSFNMTHNQPQGRYGFGLLSCLAIFWGLGMDRLIRAKRTHADLFAFFLIILFGLVNLHVLTGTVRKAFPEMPGRMVAFQKEADGNLGELTGKMVMGQTFRCEADGLDSIAVLLTTFGRYNNCHIVFHLRDLSDPTVDLVTEQVPVLKLQNDTFHFFRFNPLENSGGKNYLFFLESPDAKKGDAISCYYTQKDSYPDGHAILNNLVLKGDLTFLSGCE